MGQLQTQLPRRAPIAAWECNTDGIQQICDLLDKCVVLVSELLRMQVQQQLTHLNHLGSCRLQSRHIIACQNAMSASLISIVAPCMRRTSTVINVQDVRLRNK